MPVRVLLVCTGNTCRSPMAAALLRHHLARAGSRAAGVEVVSAGLAVASPGEPATAHAIAAMAERGLSLADHAAVSLCDVPVGRMDLILTMTGAQKARLGRLNPAVMDRLYTLAEYTGVGGGGSAGDVPDPIGGDLAAYRQCAEVLDQATAKLAMSIASEGGSSLPHVATPPPAVSMVESVLAELPVAGPLTTPAPAGNPIRRLAVGADHAGWELKNRLAAALAEAHAGLTIQDFGTGGPESVDYPDFAAKVAAAVAAGQCDAGLLVCGTGLGMAIAANKIRGIRAVTCNDLYSARLCREHNDANVLCLGARIVGQDLALEIVRTFLRTAFGGGRHTARVRKIAEFEDRPFPDRRGKDR